MNNVDVWRGRGTASCGCSSTKSSPLNERHEVAGGRSRRVWPWLVQVGCGRAGPGQIDDGVAARSRCWLMEFGDYAMMRRMLCGIKERVEAVE
jgi:hypothetical protein